jgi:hypothetical protein
MINLVSSNQPIVNEFLSEREAKSFKGYKAMFPQDKGRLLQKLGALN